MTAGLQGAALRQGKSTLPELPMAQQLMLVVPASDVLLLEVALPSALSGARLKAALPNLLEEQLLSPVDDCHFAPGSELTDLGQLPVAVIHRPWLKQVMAAVGTKQFVSISIIPEQFLQAPDSLQVSRPAVLEGESFQMVSWRKGAMGGAGFALTDLDNLWLPEAARQLSLPQSSSFEQRVARFTPPFIDLCQFEFAPPQSLFHRLGPWKSAAGMLLLLILLQVFFLNLQWGLLSWQKYRLQSELQSLMKQAVPTAPANADPVSTVARALEQQRLQAGGAMPGEFPGLAAHLALLMKGEPGDVIVHLEYDHQSLLLKFKAGYPAAPLVRKAGSIPGASLKDMGQGLWKFSWEGGR